jgi:hypothetical protein
MGDAGTGADAGSGVAVAAVGKSSVKWPCSALGRTWILYHSLEDG